jgi:hypothetical protein
MSVGIPFYRRQQAGVGALAVGAGQDQEAFGLSDHLFFQKRADQGIPLYP